MLVKLTNTIATQKCQGRFIDESTCDAINDIEISTLVLGRYDGDKDSIVLPVCSDCKISQETLMRTWEETSINFPAYTHRAAVNFLAKKLKEANKIHPACKDSIKAEIIEPTTILSDFPGLI